MLILSITASNLVLPEVVVYAYEGMDLASDIHHIHTGDRNSGGGCYTKAHYKNVQVGVREERCGGNIPYAGPWKDENNNDYYVGICERCGERYVGNGTTTTCPKIISRTPVYEKRLDYYSTECGLEDGEKIGTLWAHLDTVDWTREVKFTYGCESDGRVDLSAITYTFDNNAVSTGEEIVTENGEHSLRAVVNDNTVVDDLTVNISKIDRVAPLITRADKRGGDNVASEKIEVAALDEGCGLADQPYSFDGGRTYVSEAGLDVRHNATFNIMVRDKLGNTSNRSVTVDNIDDAPPVAEAVLSENGKTTGPVTIIVNARDVNPKGGEGIGLADEAYSFNNGSTWQKSNEYRVEANGTFAIKVRDKNGNATSLTATVNNIYKPEPTPVPTSSPDDNDKPQDDKNGKNGDDKKDDKPDGNTGGNDPDRKGSDDNGGRPGTDDPSNGDSGNDPGRDPGQKGKTPAPTPVKPRKSTADPDKNNVKPLITPSISPKTVKSSSDNDKTVKEERMVRDRQLAASPEIDDGKLKKSNTMWDFDSWGDYLLLLSMIIAGIALLILIGAGTLAVTVRDYGSTEKKLLGIAFVTCRNGSYEIKLREELIGRASTGRLGLHINPVFVMLHKGEKIFVTPFDGNGRCEKVQSKIVVDL
ncbi:MAG: hypothetical protein K5662_04790 [Lachnospiraceae bacterium]|nr:hypothetical protein [Lachnospiraceae bacterium]